jgi:hypothetical protein
VGDIIKDVTAKIDSFYKDQETAYIFTSGPTLGPSGLFNPRHYTQDLQAPLILWGQGFSSSTAYSGQAIRHKDLSMLIAALAGNELPADSSGRIPIDLLKDNSDVLKAGMILLACESSLNRMHALYHDRIERKDRLLAASSTMKDIESMGKSFDQLKVIVDNKNQLASEVIKMAQLAHGEILRKSEALLWRNSGLAMGLAAACLILASLAMYSVGYCGGKGSGDSGAFSATALCLSGISTVGLVGRGAEWPYFVWCWACGLIFAVNGAVIAPGKPPHPVAASFLIITVQNGVPDGAR